MKSRLPALLGILGLALVIAGVWLYVSRHPGTRVTTPSGDAGPPPDLAAALPFDAAISTGVLPNGLRYFVRANRTPEKRAELRLVVNAGSVLEDDDQRGLAHFVEHMAFNGTARFPKREIGAFMESIGMRFGPGVNATTSADETVYRLQVPTDQPAALARAFDVLEDWAGAVSFEATEIEKERPVVLEEWRANRNAGARVQDRQLPILLKGSRYVDRTPIGTPESIQSFAADRLRQFYKDWYRPDLMAVIAVGDFDQASVTAQVTRQFARLAAPPNPRPKPAVTVPSQPGTEFVSLADPETTVTSLVISHRREPRQAATVGAYRGDIVDRLAAAMLSQRLAEVAQTPGGPLLAGSVVRSPVVRSLEVLSMAATLRPAEIARGLTAVATERARLMKFGFTAPELDAQKEAYLRALEQAHQAKSQQVSATLAAEYVRHATAGEPVPGIEWEYDVTRRLLAGISLTDVNAAAVTSFPDANRVVFVGTPQSHAAAVSAPVLEAAMASAAAASLTPWVARVTATSLLDAEPESGTIARVNRRAAIGVTEWTLSNGVRVVLLPTTFKQDEIVFSAVSPGGVSLASDADLIPAQTASQVVNSMGFGRFGSGDLRRWLMGRTAAAQPVIGPFEEGISGGCTRHELETMFQLIHLMITSPRRDPVIFEALRSQMRDALAAQGAAPEVAFVRELTGVLSQQHPRARPLAPEDVDRMDLDKSLAFYRDRFSDASDFTFIFAGSFDEAAMRPLVEKYLASLPATQRVETWKDPGVRPPAGIVTRTVERGVEPRGRTTLVFTGPLEPDRARAVTVVALAEVLQIRLREALREELGGTYSVSVGGNAARVPVGQFTVSIDFTSDPARADALSERVLTEIKRLADGGPSARELNDVRTALLRDFETNSRQNPFLVGQLAQRYQSGEAPESVWQMPAVYRALTTAIIREAARTHLDSRRYVKVVLRPQK